MNPRLLAILIATCLVAVLIMEFWQVQQIKMIQHQLREDEQLRHDMQRLLSQQEQMLQHSERKQATQASHQQAQAAPAPAPVAAAGPSDEVKSLLQAAQDGLQRAIAANERKDLNAAAAEIPAVKDAVWKAGDLWEKYKTPLHDLMGPLDYAVKRLNRGDDADFSQAMKTVSALLRKGQ